METALRTESGVSPKVTWSAAAGVYTFLWAVVVSLLLSDILGLLSEVIGIRGSFWMVVLASPVLLVGTGTWWALVERRDACGYGSGALFGLVTALVVGLVWTAGFVTVWGFEMLAVPMVAALAAFVLGFVAVAGVVVALPLMYARRRLRRDRGVRS